MVEVGELHHTTSLGFALTSLGLSVELGRIHGENYDLEKGFYQKRAEPENEKLWHLGALG